MLRRYICLLAVIFGTATPATAETLKIMSAGSLRGALTDMIHRFPAGTDTVDAPDYGASGLMRRKIEGGAPADLFASADMDQPRKLAAGHPERMVIHFTRNSLCALARPVVDLTSANMLDRLLDPTVRIATSTPGSDPMGDYSWAVFARADAVKQGAGATLEAKALKLMGGGDKTPVLVPGKGAAEGVFLADKADVMLIYCSEAATVRHDIPSLTVVNLPPALTVGAAYGMVLLDDKPVASRFAAFMMSEAGQAVLLAHGFDPVALAAPARP